MRPAALEPNDLLLFARVADLGSFSRAAERLGLPKSTVSRRVSALESRLGERLLQRTTRKLVLTELGQAVLEHARHVAEDVEAASALAANRQVEPRGRLRVTMPHDLGNLMLAPLLARFARAHPAVTLEIDLSSRFVDLIGESFDLAIRMGELADDATLSARRVATFTQGLYASPAYLKRRGAPRDPEGLMAHEALHVASRSGEPMPWALRRGAAEWRGVPPARAIANSPELLMRMALEGAGIAIVTDHFALAHVKKKQLACVLPKWRPAPVAAWAVFPGRRLMPAKTRAFIDALAALFSGPECRAAEGAATSRSPARASSARARP
ncbi:MAG TPA: LysR family transcriptional regulator [Usitatibacter sp.]|nr:LysR family transcriptional regulator [Usitatibacter sp.]